MVLDIMSVGATIVSQMNSISWWVDVLVASIILKVKQDYQGFETGWRFALQVSQKRYA